MGLLGSVLVAASPERPGVVVRLVAAGLGDDGPAQLARQFGHGDRDQPWAAAVLLSRAVIADGAGVAVPSQEQHGVPVVLPVRGCRRR